MRKFLFAAAAALTLSACATATPYQPVTPGHSSEGYSDLQVEATRYRVSFNGNSVTSRETVETYLLYRAAELTVQNGYDWFQTADRSTEKDTRLVGTADPWGGYGGFGYGGYGGYWRPSWRFYRGGGWGPWGAGWGSDFDVQEVTRYQANAEVILHKGPKPVGDPRAFDARDVLANLGPHILRPEPKAPLKS